MLYIRTCTCWIKYFCGFLWGYCGICIKTGRSNSKLNFGSPIFNYILVKGKSLSLQFFLASCTCVVLTTEVTKQRVVMALVLFALVLCSVWMCVGVLQVLDLVELRCHYGNWERHKTSYLSPPAQTPVCRSLHHSSSSVRFCVVLFCITLTTHTSYDLQHPYT